MAQAGLIGRVERAGNVNPVGIDPARHEKNLYDHRSRVLTWREPIRLEYEWQHPGALDG